ncbi:MAG: ATP-binding protein [Cyclobacteriaceae bacterium]|nr:ATP-binding protein [Cyclobacteriaceae bacterium]
MDDQRLSEIQKFIINVANGSDYNYLTPSNKEDSIDAIMVGINMLVEELIKRQKLDIDEATRKKQIAESLAETRGKFLSNMSHEIRTPLNGIIGMIDLMKRDPNLTNKQSEDMNILSRSSEQLLVIANNVLDLKKLEENKLEIQLIPVNMNKLLNDLSKLFMEQAEKKGLKIELVIPSDFPQSIEIDKVKVSQIISNLILNAIKFSEEGTIEVIITIIEIHKNKVRFKVQVIDYGIGIPEESLGQIFQKYKQLDNAYSNSIRGTGLGLAICKELVMLIDGKIGVESKLGVGSTFWIILESNIITEISELDKSPSKVRNDLGFNCLLVDDDDMNIYIGKRMLKKLGCHIWTATNGELAVEMFEEGKFDIILMDIHMPVMDGVTTTKKIKEQNKLVPPIIGVTADTIKGVREKYIADGLDDHLGKPYKLEELYSMIMKWTCI